MSYNYYHAQAIMNMGISLMTLKNMMVFWLVIRERRLLKGLLYPSRWKSGGKVKCLLLSSGATLNDTGRRMLNQHKIQHTSVRPQENYLLHKCDWATVKEDLDHVSIRIGIHRHNKTLVLLCLFASIELTPSIFPYHMWQSR